MNKLSATLVSSYFHPVSNGITCLIWIQIISNGKLKSTLHRAVTNTSIARMSLCSFIGPSPESIIEPAKALVSESNPKLFKPISSKDYFEIYMVEVRGPKGSALELVKV